MYNLPKHTDINVRHAINERMPNRPLPHHASVNYILRQLHNHRYHNSIINLATVFHSHNRANQKGKG